MTLEATVCMLDNSDYSINSDVTPTRLAAAADAVKTIFRAKTQSNPESTCGLMTYAGSGPVVLVSPTTEEGKIHASLPTVKAQGSADLLSGLSVAGLALKHRQEKNQRQRAIVLLSSPLPQSLTIDDLVKLGKRLKKNNVAVDVILFGSEATENEERMRAFVEAVNSSGNSKFLTVPAGLPGLLSDHIKQSEILSEDGFGSGAGVGRTDAGGSEGETGQFDLDPNLDPELVMALRMSLQEEEARQAALRRETLQPVESISQPSTIIENPAMPPSELAPTTSVPATLDMGVGNEDEEMAEDEHAVGADDEELARALAMSKQDDVNMGDVEDVDDDESEQEAIARAIEMSMKKPADQTDQSQK